MIVIIQNAENAHLVGKSRGGRVEHCQLRASLHRCKLLHRLEQKKRNIIICLVILVTYK